MPPITTTYKLSEAETIGPGSLILISYKNGPLWPALVNKLTIPKKTAHYKFLPIYQGDYSLKSPFAKIQLYKPGMEAAADADNDLKQAFDAAREYYEYSEEHALELFKNPPPRPEPVKKEKPANEEDANKKVKLGKRKLRQPERPHDDTEVAGDDGEDDELMSNASDDEDQAPADELDTILGNQQRSNQARPAKRIRKMKHNEVVFADAPSTEFKSKDQVVLIRNPNGAGLWPALPNIISDEKCHATFELFPRHIVRTRNARHQPKLFSTTDTQIFAFDERKINSMIEFSHERDPKLHDALVDVRSYLQDNHRFEEAKQIDGQFKDQEIFVEVARPENQEDKNSQPAGDAESSSTLALSELYLTNSAGDKLSSAMKVSDAPIHTLSKRQLQDQKLMQEKFAMARQDPKPMWMFNHRIHKPHVELSFTDLTSQKVHEYFEKIWSGQARCPLHDQFLKNMNNLKPYYPSSYRINGCTGGMISNHDVDSALQEYHSWIELSTKLPRFKSMIEKLRYSLEVMLKEACVFLLAEKRKCTRDLAEKFLLDSQDYVFAKERGFIPDGLQKRVLDEPNS